MAADGPATLSRSLCLALVALGSLFRFVHLDTKPYWYDEVSTSVRVSGFTNAEVKQTLAAQGPVSQREFARYQEPNPERSVAGTVRGLALDEPHLPPLYFVTARLWVEAFGNSTTARRGFSAVVSLLLFPALFWLCRELFPGGPDGRIAVALAAASPFHLVYAQEARPYALWSVVIVVSSAALLRAMRRGTRRAWFLYGVTVAISLYTFLLSALVLAAHAMYLLLESRSQSSITPTPSVKRFLLAAGAGVLAAVPWFAVVAQGLPTAGRMTAWTLGDVTRGELVGAWIANAAWPFVDFHRTGAGTPLAALRFPLYLGAAGLVIYAVCALARRRSRPARFALLLIGSAAGPLLLIDLLAGGHLTAVTRYLTPSLIGIQLAVSHLFATRIAAGGRWRTRWRAGLLILLTVGAVSSVIYLRAPTWWSKGDSLQHLEVAEIVNQAPGSLLLAEGPITVMALGYLLDPENQVQLVGEARSFEPAGGFQNVFVYDPSAALRVRLAESGALEALLPEGQLWRLEAVQTGSLREPPRTSATPPPRP